MNWDSRINWEFEQGGKYSNHSPTVRMVEIPKMVEFPYIQKPTIERIPKDRKSRFFGGA